MSVLPVEQQLALIKRGAVDILPVEELKEKLRKSIETATPIKTLMNYGSCIRHKDRISTNA